LIESKYTAALNSLFNNFLSIYEALPIFNSFVKIAQRETIVRCIDDLALKVCRLYEDQLDQIRVRFDRHKSDPPLRLNDPKCAGSANWAKSIIIEIENIQKLMDESCYQFRKRQISPADLKREDILSDLLIYQNFQFSSWVKEASAYEASDLKEGLQRVSVVFGTHRKFLSTRILSTSL